MGSGALRQFPAFPQSFSADSQNRSEVGHVACVCCRRHVPQLAHWLQPDTNAFIPWKSTQKRCLHEKVFWDLLFPGQVLGWLRELGYKW